MNPHAAHEAMLPTSLTGGATKREPGSVPVGNRPVKHSSTSSGELPEVHALVPLPLSRV